MHTVKPGTLVSETTTISAHDWNRFRLFFLLAQAYISVLPLGARHLSGEMLEWFLEQIGFA